MGSESFFETEGREGSLPKQFYIKFGTQEEAGKAYEVFKHLQGKKIQPFPGQVFEGQSYDPGISAQGDMTSLELDFSEVSTDLTETLWRLLEEKGIKPVEMYLKGSKDPITFGKKAEILQMPAKPEQQTPLEKAA